MKCLTLWCVLPAVVVFASGPAAREEAARTHEVKLNGHVFTLPVGFEIELVAGPPLVDRPIVADFDEQGRLYVADSSGTNDKVDVQLRERPHRILRLEDTDGDGRFDKHTVFADKMMFPEGTMWYAGSLYVSAPPSIWKLTDTDGDGVADQRSEWFQGKTLTGCANDLHGPYLGPDGWIYWCKGAFAKQTYERPGHAKPFETRAAHIFRCRPDGTGIEPVMTGGMDNPVDVVFTPGGERIFTTTFLQTPGGGNRDGLIHAIYGGINGKDHDPIYEHKWTGPSLMPVLVHMGPAAPCGLTRYESRVFGPEYQDNLFACQFNMRKVSRHVLTPDGATFKSRDEDFLVSNNLDFHPTDVLEDADGSLLVIDTGGWYKLCCPSSQLHKPDVLGGIYRIRKTGAPRVQDPRGLKLGWDKLSVKELTGLLEDPRPAVRKRAIEALSRQGTEALGALAEVIRSGPSPEARRNAIWAATRIDQPQARALVRAALADADATTRQVAIHSVSVWRDREAVPALLKLLKSPSLHNRRAAAEALGRIGDGAAVPALLEAAGEPADRVLEHSLTYALIEIADPGRTGIGSQSANVRTRRAALVALDQMDGGPGLEARVVAAELASPDAAMKETAWWLASRHPEWGGALAGFLRERLAAKNLPPAEQDALARQLAKFARATPAQKLLADLLNDSSASRETHQIVLRAMAQTGLRQVPEAWVAGVIHLLESNDAERVREAITTARALNINRERDKAKAEKLTAALLQLADQDKLEAPVRLAALAAVPGGLTEVKPPLFSLLRTQLNPEQPVAVRALAVDVLSKARLHADQLLALTEVLKSVGPLEVDHLLDAFTTSKDDAVGQRLIAALKESPARSNLRAEAIKARLAKYGPSVQKQAEELYLALNADLAKQQAKLEELLPKVSNGDIRRGQAVFQSQKAACFTCHAIGYKGGHVGPDLTRIGSIRSERDLLESIVFPSASFVRSFEPVLVTTKSGKTHNGLIKKDSAEEIVLTTGADQEVRLTREDIEEIVPSKTSIMPAGLDQQLTVQELADLVAFLRACK